MSETHDPWKEVRPFRLTLLSDLQSGSTEATLYYAAEVDAARAAEATQHAEQDAMHRGMFQRACERAAKAEARLAAVEAERDAFKAENGEVRRLAVKERANMAAFADLAEAERDRLKAALELVYGAFIEQGLDSSYTYADDAARAALSAKTPEQTPLPWRQTA